MVTIAEQLRHIQDGAISSGMPVSELLRRCQVLAARVKLPELGDWVRYELNGYPESVDLPEYRIFNGVAKGHFIGPFGSRISYADLPAGNLPDAYRDWARKAYIRQPIAVVEEVANQRGKKDNIHIPWPADLVVRVQDLFYEHLHLAQAWLDISHTDFVSAVESVRNRILSFALDAEQYVNKDEDEIPQSSAQLSNVFHTHIYGAVGNIAQGSSNISQQAVVAAGDQRDLFQQLQRIGVPSDDLHDLDTAIAEDGPVQNQKLGARVAGWVGKMIGKAMSGTWQVATTTATNVLPKLIEHYYGIQK